MADEVPNNKNFNPEGDDFDEESYIEAEPGEQRDISLAGEDGGIIKEIITPGTGWEKPEKGDKVTVHYTGTLVDGTQFDSSRDRGDPFTFTIGQGSVIKGWDIGVATMKHGERSRLTIRSDYGYGDAGSPPTIPGGATLVFDVELISWKSVKDIAGDGGVMKTVLSEGAGWDQPKPVDEVLVKISAKVQGASEAFYKSPEEGEEYTLGDGGLCKGVDVAVGHMKKGEVARLVVKPEYGFGGEGRSPEVPPNATLDIDLTLVSWKKVENVTPDHGVMKKILQDVDDYKKPNPGSKVKVVYIGRLTDGTVFDQCSQDQPLEFTTDEEQAPCEGFELALARMKKGEKAFITIQPHYAFGANGTAAVPPNTVVTYEMTLVDFEKAKDSWEMETPEKLATAGAVKEKGNAAFKAGKISRAVKLWERAKGYVEFDDNFEAEEKKEGKDITKSCNLNLAAAYLKLGQPEEAKKAADKVLEKDSFNLKGLYRRAQAYMATSDWVEAEVDLKKGLGMEPENTDFKILLKKLRQQTAAADKKEAALWAGAFGKMAKSAAKESKQEKEGAAAAPKTETEMETED